MKTIREFLTEVKQTNENKDVQLEKFIKFSKNDIENIKKILGGIVERIEAVELNNKDMEVNRKNYIKFSNSDIEKIEKIGNEIVSRLEDLK